MTISERMFQIMEEQPITLRTDSPGQENQLTGGANNGFPNTGDPNTIKD